MACHCYCVTGLSDILPIPCRRGRPPKWPKHMHVQPTKSACSPTMVSAVPPSRSTNSIPFSSPMTGDAASKTIVKGNIMYKRTETGEVIASVIKNGPKLATTVSAAAPANRGRPPSDSSTTASLCVAGEPSLPTDCPVNETNVEHILEESITATQSMRRTLVSLKDDLRRMGGGAVMSPSLKPIHIQHRINIAYKLARAFADYRSTMNGVSSGKSARSTVTSSHSVTCSKMVTPVPSSQMVTPVSLFQTATPVPSSQTATPVPSSQVATPVPSSQMVTAVPSLAVCAVNSAPVTCSSQHGAAEAMTSSSSQKTATSEADTVLKQTTGDVMNVVSDDLLMSCEAEHD